MGGTAGRKCKRRNTENEEWDGKKSGHHHEGHRKKLLWLNVSEKEKGKKNQRIHAGIMELTGGGETRKRRKKVSEGNWKKKKVSGGIIGRLRHRWSRTVQRGSWP